MIVLTPIALFSELHCLQNLMAASTQMKWRECLGNFITCSDTRWSQLDTQRRCPMKILEDLSCTVCSRIGDRSIHKATRQRQYSSLFSLMQAFCIPDASLALTAHPWQHLTSLSPWYLNTTIKNWRWQQRCGNEAKIFTMEPNSELSSQHHSC